MYYARVLLRKDHRFFVLKNTERNRWEFPGGKQEPGESLENSAVRELHEETGVIVIPGDLKFVTGVSRRFDNEQCYGYYYVTDTFAGWPVPQEDKFEKGKWMTIGELALQVQIPALVVDVARIAEEQV